MGSEFLCFVRIMDGFIKYEKGYVRLSLDTGPVFWTIGLFGLLDNDLHAPLYLSLTGQKYKRKGGCASGFRCTGRYFRRNG